MAHFDPTHFDPTHFDTGGEGGQPPIPPSIPSTDIEVYIMIMSILNRMPLSLIRSVVLYAPLRDSLGYVGAEPVTFERPTIQTAAWRDGFNHPVGINKPRFEYIGDTPIGMAISADETFGYNALNNLHDNNSLFWIQEGITKHYPIASPCPFSAEGLWIGDVDIHVRDIIKFNRIITNPIELSIIASLLTNDIIVTPPVPEEAYGRTAISPGVDNALITHNLNFSNVVWDAAASWPTLVYEISRSANSFVVRFTVPCPPGGGFLSWGVRR